MRFTFADAMVDPAFLRPLAVAAEEAGYDGFVVPDSICYPEVSDSTYPYSPDGTREFLEDKPFLEPFSLIPYLAAATTTLRFTTFVVKLPVRHPVLVAKQATSVSVLADGRFALGVGVSPWPDDYEILDVPWEKRGQRMDEAIDIIRGLSAGGYFEHHGEIYDVASVKICPVPDRPAPILVGGHSDAALRRAARRGDGWLHAGGGPEDLADLLPKLRRFRDEVGRSDEPFETHVISLDAYTPDGIARLGDLGVTDVIVGFRDAYQPGPDTQTLDEKLDALRWYADEIIADVKA
ncbi:MAG: TIGR03619 family F420-dependent LLM class oxidoreductase [Acidimicrobiia bacterium]